MKLNYVIWNQGGVFTTLLFKLLLLKEKSLNPLDSYQNPKLQKSAPFLQSLLAKKLWLLNKKFLSEENGITTDFLFRDIINTHTESFQPFFFCSTILYICSRKILPSSMNCNALNSHGVQAPLCSATFSSSKRSHLPLTVHLQKHNFTYFIQSFTRETWDFLLFPCRLKVSCSPSSVPKATIIP